MPTALLIATSGNSASRLCLDPQRGIIVQKGQRQGTEGSFNWTDGAPGDLAGVYAAMPKPQQDKLFGLLGLGAKVAVVKDILHTVDQPGNISPACTALRHILQSHPGINTVVQGRMANLSPRAIVGINEPAAVPFYDMASKAVQGLKAIENYGGDHHPGQKRLILKSYKTPEPQEQTDWVEAATFDRSMGVIKHLVAKQAIPPVALVTDIPAKAPISHAPSGMEI